MSDVESQVGVSLLGPGNNNSSDAFDGFIDEHIVNALSDEKSDEKSNSSLWVARRAGKYLAREALLGNVSKAHLGLAAIERGSRTMALSVKYQALRVLELHSSGSDENPIVERVRSQFLGSVGMQLAWDSELSDSERAFTVSDAKQFFGSHFSFETRRQLADILGAYGYHNPEVVEEIENLFTLPGFNADVQNPGSNQENTSGPTVIGVLQAPPEELPAGSPLGDVLKEVPGDSNNDESVKPLTENTMSCPLCWGAGKIYIQSSNHEGLIPQTCGECGGDGVVKYKPDE